MSREKNLVVLIGGEKIKKYTIADRVWEEIRVYFNADFTHRIISLGTIDELHTTMDTLLQDSEFRGGNVALPWKNEMYNRCSEHDVFTQETGIVSAFTRRGEALKSFNMDAVAITTALEYEGIALAGRSVLILGAGGAGRSLAYFLAQQNVDVTITDIDEEVLQKVLPVPNLRVLSRADVNFRIYAFNIVVNATTVGNVAYWGSESYVFASPLSIDELQSLPTHAVCIEMNYKPRLTHFLQVSALTGKYIIPGLDMLLLQALFTAKEVLGIIFNQGDFIAIKHKIPLL